MGSPPPMRGKADDLGKDIAADGITPAYAGKSIPAVDPAILNRDHPRLCGEKQKAGRIHPHRLGSPPPMRGKVWQGSARGLMSGITPAYAGKRYLPEIPDATVRDHPRLCGEKFFLLLKASIRIGSPPPMRGKAVDLMIGLRSVGITPAYAGKSVLPCHWLFRVRDHPRLCGEKSKISHHFGVTTEDHPRLCGEKIRKKKCVMRNIGSPPPMRGKAQNCGKRRCVHRITPAYAGKRSWRESAGLFSQDHPRLCGEKLCARIQSVKK